MLANQIQSGHHVQYEHTLRQILMADSDLPRFARILGILEVGYQPATAPQITDWKCILVSLKEA